MTTESGQRAAPHKIAWFGELLGVQPRIDLGRSFDQRQHSYLGDALFLRGEVGGEAREFSLRIGPGAQARHAFRAGDRVSGAAHPAADRERETAELYKASALRLVARAEGEPPPGPPWRGVPPALEVYRARGHRRLDARTYEAKCRTCIWGCRMAVEMMIDQWKPEVREQRFETFCYGPKSCVLYRAGPTRKVPGRKGMSWEEEDWVDEEATGHRAADE
ncbi:MAG TPA: hypothetical protein VNE59_06715 [Burkholderiales bacterium]|nr:hypothetical protein [Burkholderiales bacterium]